VFTHLKYETLFDYRKQAIQRAKEVSSFARVDEHFSPSDLD